MLRSVEIQNYQSHRDTVLNFAPGMNVITGTSDSGKSALFRAMLWALKNRPSGEAFKSWDAGEKDTVSVSMEFDDGWFTKTRANNKNKYETDDGSFEALRSDVPESVQEIAKISDYNIQTQFQQYFMLQDSAGERAKRLNELVGLDIIDRVFKKLNGKVITTKQDISRTNLAIACQLELVDSYSELPSVALQVKRLSDTIDKHATDSGSMMSVRDMLLKIDEIDSQIETQKKILALEPKFLILCEDIGNRDATRADLHHLSVVLTNLESIEDSYKADTEWLAIEIPYQALMNLVTARSEYAGDCLNLSNVIEQAKSLDGSITAKQFSIDSMVGNYINQLEASGTCPTCKSSVSAQTIAGIIKTLKG